MAGKLLEGFDWLQTGYSASTISTLFEAAGYYIRGDSPGYFGGTSVITGRWGYGYRLSVTSTASVGNANAWRATIWPVGAHTVSGRVSAGLNMLGDAYRAYPFLGVYDLVNDLMLCSVEFAPNGVAKAYRGTPTTGVFIGSSEAGAFDNNTDIDAECFFTIDSAVGEVEVRIDTISVLHLINVDTQPGSNAYFDGVCWGDAGGGGGTSAHYFIDDFRYYDTTGAHNNTWLGTCRIQTSFAASNGTTTNFTRSNTGLANWQNVKNLNIDDTLYLFDPNVGDINESGIDPLVNSPVVFFVQVDVWARQDDATQMYIETMINSSGTTAFGARFPTTQTYSRDKDIYELNPATSLSFTGAQVNALQIGLKIVS